MLLGHRGPGRDTGNPHSQAERLTTMPFLFLTATLLLQGSRDTAASFSELRWNREPTIVFPLTLFFLIYALGATRRGNIGKLRWRHTAFFAGWFSLVLGLTSPLHELGEQLFSAHMLQHEILILVSAPLISASHPGATLLWALAPLRRSRIGSWVRILEQSKIIETLTAPLAAWLMGAAALWIWHVPVLYQATLTSDWVHAAQHLSFLFSAIVFWSALYGVGRSAMSYGAATFYTFSTAAHCSALGALLTFSTVLWYPAYRATSEPWGLTPMQDQQLGGVIMWVPSGLVFLIVGLWLFALWIGESERRARLSSVAALAKKEPE
jgi:putative membrane protein